MGGLMWFAIWSIGIGFAPTEVAIFLMRGLQGLGSAATIVRAPLTED